MPTYQSRPVKPETEVSGIVRQALESLVCSGQPNGLNKHEIWGYRSGDARVILRGHTNFEQYGWAVYSGRLGHWQISIKHGQFLVGKPKQVQLSGYTEWLLKRIEGDRGVVRMEAH